MAWLAEAISRFFDLLLLPFGEHRWAALAAVSVLSGVLLLWLFKVTTDQRALTKRRRRLTGHLYELGLYQDDLGTLVKVQWALLKANLRYLGTSLPALLVLLPAVVVIVVQLDARYQRRPLAAGETALVSVRIAEGREDALANLALEPGPGLDVSAGPVVDRAGREVWWRVVATGAAPATLAVTDGAGSLGKVLAPASELGRLAGSREAAGWHHLLFNPAETALPGDAALTRIAVSLPRRDADRAGLPVWLWGFFGMSIVGGLVFKRVLRVEL